MQIDQMHTLNMTRSPWPNLPRPKRPGHDEQPARQQPLPEKEKQRLKEQHTEWVRHIVLHAIGGFLLGALIVAGIIWLDINRIGTMVRHSDSGLLFIMLMVAGFGSTFGMVASGTAIYFKSLENKDDPS